jgi:hypothetical protein
MREHDGASESAIKSGFQALLHEEGYEDFIVAIVNEWMGLRYNTALRAASPPTVRQISQTVARRKEEKKKEAHAVSTAKDIIGARLLDILTPNGKALRDCTGADCIKFGGLYARIGKKVGDRRVVGKVLSAADLSAMMRAM